MRKSIEEDIYEARKIGLRNMEGLELALARLGELNEWNKALGKLYDLADRVEYSHAFDPEFGFTHEKALRLRKWISCIPDVGV